MILIHSVELRNPEDGNGFGLLIVIVKCFTEAMDGTVGVRNNQGLEITMTFPAACKEEKNGHE